VKPTLRSYSPEDFETLFALDHACYEPAIAYSRRELRNYLRFPGANCVVAEAESKIIGFCLTEHEDDWGYIVTMDVLSEFRRKGVATALLQEAERRLAAAGVREVALETAIDNETAIAFWQKHGYRSVGVREGYYPGGRDAFSMTKRLPAPSAASLS
jgi:ribosomal protein S18 acetylase RimI-like enzyme